ncbi:MAB_1171c family putative transporter [Streptomyces sp. NPDC091201]|uniref:MAB_1171c family putative transporter n=1 Tax=Streptomyces sp. NPDC091201 TaxID=3155190 RepID=UPI00341FF5C5
MEDQSLLAYICAAALGTATCLKVPALIRNPQDRLLRAVVVLLFVATLVWLCVAVPTVALINNVIGVPNVAAPVVYAILTMFSGSCVVLMIWWQSGPEQVESTRRASRICYTLYATVAVLIVVCFLLGDAPVERVQDLDTYYANTPFIREMILLYLLAHTVASITMTILCMRWAREVHGALRSGLVILFLGFAVNLTFDAIKYVAIFGVWTGRDWEWLSTNVAPPVASVSALLVGAGFVIPLLGHRIADQWQTLRRYRHLEPLWREMVRAETPSHYVLTNRWAPLALRLTVRESFIDDGILHIGPHLDPAVRRHSYREALRAGHPAEQAEAIADAHMVSAAADAAAAHRTASPPNPRPPQVPEDLVRAVAAFQSPVIDDAVRRAAPSESSPE